MNDDSDNTPHAPAVLLRLVEEDARVLLTRLEPGGLTADVQINLTFADQHGTRYRAERVLRMKLKKEAGQ